KQDLQSIPTRRSSDLLINLDMDNKAVRNNGGGFYNHSLFWEVMNPEGKGRLSGELKDAIEAAYGSFDAFKDAFSKAAATQFGSRSEEHTSELQSRENL